MSTKHQPCGKQGCINCWAPATGFDGQAAPNNPWQSERLKDGYTAVDMANAAADGFRDGRESVGLLLGKGFNTLNQAGGKYSIALAFQTGDDAYAAYSEIATIVRLAGEAMSKEG